MPADSPLDPLPTGAVLLHIGPYKTGSTALQMVMHERREELASYGVAYPGDRHRQMRPGWGLLGKTPRARPHATLAEWEALVEEVAGTPGTVVLSTEDFGHAGPRAIDRMVADLTPERLHVIAVARRLDVLLPSQWQERVKTCYATETYDAWLRIVLEGDREHPEAKAFWGSHGLESMLERWTERLDPERFVLIVSDDSDRRLIPAAFEELLGLPADLLTPAPGRNASLGMATVELYRQVNETFARHGWPDANYRRMVQLGMLDALKVLPTDPDEPRIPPLPRWAAARVAELSQRRAAAVRSCGVRVVGDPDSLLTSVPEDAGDDAPPEPDTIAISTATAAIEGLVSGALIREANLTEGRRPCPPSVEETPGRELARELWRRAGAKLARRGQPRAH